MSCLRKPLILLWPKNAFGLPKRHNLMRSRVIRQATVHVEPPVGAEKAQQALKGELAVIEAEKPSLPRGK
ncbi:hypothetical protein ACSQ67_003178 [Phaseolus vulgaris]